MRFLKITAKVFIIAFTVLSFSNVGYSQGFVDDSKIDKGIIRVDFNTDKRSKLIISKDKITRTYDFNKNSYCPLQLGNGKYKISIWELKSGSTYKKIKDFYVELEIEDQTLPFLQSIQMVEWNNGNKAIIKGKDLNKAAKTDLEKINNVYNYITKNVKYDFVKAKNIGNIYTPNIDKIIEEKTAICYDFAVLNAAMLRSQGVPTKLVTGYRKDISSYHAWNEVLVDGQWKVVDATYDSAYAQKNRKISLFKNALDYKIEAKY